VLEGMDRVGKTTQVQNIVKELQSKGVKCEGISFPNRTTPMGVLIDKYLKKEVKIDSKEAVTLLFTANRWECKAEMERKMKEGVTLICDRYVLSGLAYAQANGLSLSFTGPPEFGLPKPALTLYLVKDTAFVEAKAGQDPPAEIYETTPFQKRVHEAFVDLIKGETRFQTVNVTNKTIPTVLGECMKQVEAVLNKYT